MLSYFLTAGDGIGWAIDEDARLIRRALRGLARERALPFARVVHSPFWVALEHHAPAALRHRFVVAHADNPPFFYLTQAGFARAQRTVDLWVARSRESLTQFQELGLEAVLIPYAIDERLFAPIADRAGARRALGIPDDAYVIGNFHRDTEGRNLTLPKAQKAPELFAKILGGLRETGCKVCALLAGPRRHWLLRRLRELRVPYVFVGEEPGESDDISRNVLPRARLKELYAACDLYLITSRWEGGPQSAMEAAACGTKILSTPVGVALDILEQRSLFHTPSEAIEKIRDDIRSGSLSETIEPQLSRWREKHTSAAMAAGLRDLYRTIEERVPREVDVFRSLAEEAMWRIRRRLPPARGRVKILHLEGHCPATDAAVAEIRALAAGLSVPGSIVGVVDEPERLRGGIQVLGPSTSRWVPEAILVAASVREVLAVKRQGARNPVVVFPFGIGTSEPGEPFVVPRDGPDRSREVLSALKARRPVVYPAEMPAYGWQAFLAGVPFTGDPRDALALAEGLGEFAWVPGREEARAFLRQLLKEAGGA